MPNYRDVNPFDASGHRSELGRLVRQIQALTLELRELREREPDTPELGTKERMLEQLRWRLAAVAAQAAADDPVAAA
jgi:hypothetical protein